MIFAPHQDDDIIGAGCGIFRALKEKKEVIIVFITKGAFEGGISRDKKSIREKEAIYVMKRAGIKKYYFLNKYIFEMKKRKVAEEVFGKILWMLNLEKPNEAYFPAYEGGNFDHDIINFIVSKAVSKSGRKIRMFEFPMYSSHVGIKNVLKKATRKISERTRWKYAFRPEFINNRGQEIVVGTKKEVALKKKFLKMYKSQNPDELVRYFGYPDKFRQYKKYDYSKPPYAFSLNFLLPKKFRIYDGKISFSKFKKAISF